MTLAIVVLDAIWFLRKAPRSIATTANQKRIFLYELASIIYQAHIGRHFGHLILRVGTSKGVNAHGGKVGNLIKVCIITHTLVSIKLHFGNIATSIIGTHVTHITEASGNHHVRIISHPVCSCLGNEIQRKGI